MAYTKTRGPLARTTTLIMPEPTFKVVISIESFGERSLSGINSLSQSGTTADTTLHHGFGLTRWTIGWIGFWIGFGLDFRILNFNPK